MLSKGEGQYPRRLGDAGSAHPPPLPRRPFFLTSGGLHPLSCPRTPPTLNEISPCRHCLGACLSSSLSLYPRLLWATLSGLTGHRYPSLHGSAAAANIVHALCELEENELLCSRSKRGPAHDAQFGSAITGDMTQQPRLEASFWFKILCPGSRYIGPIHGSWRAQLPVISTEAMSAGVEGGTGGKALRTRAALGLLPPQL